MTGIIIVDDHLLFREGVKLLIESEGIGTVIAEADNGLTFFNMLDRMKPDLVLMDIEMPIMNGVEATKRAKSIMPDIKILVLTMHGVEEHFAEMISAGANGFILKTAGKKELQKAISTIMSGESYFAQEMMKQIILNLHSAGTVKKPNQDVPELSEREIEVLKYLCKGLTTSEIADKLCRSTKTIEAHRARLLEKTGSRNTITLLVYAINNKIIQI